MPTGGGCELGIMSGRVGSLFLKIFTEPNQSVSSHPKPTPTKIDEKPFGSVHLLPVPFGRFGDEQ